MGSAKHQLWACPAYRGTRLDLLPTHQHQGREAWCAYPVGSALLDARTMAQFLCGYITVSWATVLEAYGFVDGFLMCKHGAQGGQAGRAVAQVHEATLVCSAHGAMPISLPEQRRILLALHCGRPSSCRSQERRSFLTVQQCSEAWNVGRNGAQRRGGRMLTCGGKSGTASETLGTKPTSTL